MNVSWKLLEEPWQPPLTVSFTFVLQEAEAFALYHKALDLQKHDKFDESSKAYHELLKTPLLKEVQQITPYHEIQNIFHFIFSSSFIYCLLFFKDSVWLIVNDFISFDFSCTRQWHLKMRKSDSSIRGWCWNTPPIKTWPVLLCSEMI